MKEVIERYMTPITIAKAVMGSLGIAYYRTNPGWNIGLYKILYCRIPTPYIFAGGEYARTF